MATAQIKTSVLLEMSEIEAYALQTILNLIGGDPETSIRKYSDDISDALADAGISQTNVPNSSDICERNRQEVYFNDNSIDSLVKLLSREVRST